MLASFPAFEHAGQESTGVSGTEAPTTPSQRDAVHLAGSGSRGHRPVAHRLQHRPAALPDRLADAG